MRVYAGIGSRETPPEFREVMRALATALADEGWTLRSGHAPGADQAFESGARGRAEVYLPWPEFGNEVEVVASVILDRPTSGALNIAAAHHPAWDRLGRGARLLHGRNTHIVLGRDCLPDEAVRFVVGWTPQAREVGGTAQAIRLARYYGIEVFNLADPVHFRRVLAVTR